MRIIVFGVAGALGQYALQACLEDSAVTHVLGITNAASATEHVK